jgi:hypothetical protein
MVAVKLLTKSSIKHWGREKEMNQERDEDIDDTESAVSTLIIRSQR